MFRDMRRSGQRLGRKECEEILRAAPRGVLALLGDGDYPYAVPLDFVYYQGRIYFHSAIEGHKLDALAAHDKVSFCVLDEGHKSEGEWWWSFRSVIAFGRARVLEDRASALEALRQLGLKYFPPTKSVDDSIARSGARTAVIELAIDHMTGKRVREK